MTTGVIDAHAHFWDPGALHYPWLTALPPLDRPFLPHAYAADAAGIPLAGVIFVECNCLPEESDREVALVELLAETEPRLAGIVAFVDLSDAAARESALARLRGVSLVRGVRQNIQGQPPGFALEEELVRGVQRVGDLGLTFDLCATHDQLGEVAVLAARCPDTRLVLDHCGKPPIRERGWEPWRTSIARIAAHPNVVCKLSGLLTEAAPACDDEALVPYAAHVLDAFGAERLMYGSDWPVLTLAGTHQRWYDFTARFTAAWRPAERRCFYHDTAVRVYGL